MTSSSLMTSKFKGLFITILIFLVSILAFQKNSNALVESTPCSSEPTDMSISYGDVITCAIDTSGDSDLFEFSGSSGDVIVVQSVWTSGTMRPCIELKAPDNSIIEACKNAFTNRIDTTLTQTGNHTVIVDVFFGGTGDYVLALERLKPPSANALEIQHGELIEGQIAPNGELDTFYFDGNVNESILFQITWQNGSVRPCIELVAPDNSRTDQCANAFKNRIDTTLSQSGTYTVLVDAFYGGAGDYSVVLERLMLPSENAQQLPFGSSVGDEINPVGDLDLFTFDGTSGDHIVLTTSWQSGTMRPCVQLVYPDNSRQVACNNAFSNEIDITLNQTGSYAVLAEVFYGGTGNYNLELQCISGACKNFVYLPILVAE